MVSSSSLGALLAMAGAASLVILLIMVVFYILKSIGLYKLANKRGFENPWLAWIPIGDLYILGLIVGEMDIFSFFHLENLGLWCPVIVIVGAVCSGIPILGIIFSIALLIFSILIIYKLFQLYTPNAVLFTILSILLGLFPIFVFVIRNNELISAAVNTAAPVPPTVPENNEIDAGNAE